MTAPNTPASNDFVLVPEKRKAMARMLCEQHGGEPDAFASEEHDSWEGPLWTAFLAEADRVLALAAAPASPEPLNKERRNNAELLASICQKARHSSASPVERDEALRDAATMLRDFARTVAPAASPEPASNDFVLVPRVPSMAQMNAAVDATGAGSDMSWVGRSPQKLFAQAWAAMLAAAPASPEPASNEAQVGKWVSPSLGRAYAEVERVRDGMAQHPESGIDEALRRALEAIEAADCELIGVAS